MSRYIFFTFRPHPNDLQLFEDYLTLFLPWLATQEKSCYSIEKDNTLARHIHAVIYGYRDKEKFLNSATSFKFKPYKEFIKKEGSSTDAAWDTKTIKDSTEDIMKTIGYTMKDPSSSRNGYTGFSDPYITECVQYYYANKRLEASKPSYDYKIINDKNFYRYVEEFITENNIDINDKHLFIEMAKQGQMIQVPDKKVKLYLAQTAIKLGIATNRNLNVVKHYNTQSHIDEDEYTISQLESKLDQAQCIIQAYRKQCNTPTYQNVNNKSVYKDPTISSFDLEDDPQFT